MKKFVFLFLLVFLFLYKSDTVLADDVYVVQLPDLPEYNTTDYPYYYIKRNNEYEYTLYILEGDYVSKNDEYYYFTKKWKKSTYRVSETAGQNVWGSFVGPYNGYSDNSKICDMNYQNCNIVYCNFDIKYNDTLLFGKREINTDGFEDVDDTPTLSGIGGFFTDLITNMGNFFGNLINTLTSWLSTVSNNILSIGTNIVNAINNIQDFIFNGVKSAFEYLFIPDEDIFNDLSSLVREKFSVLFDVKELIDTILDATLYAGTPTFSINYKGKIFSIVDFSMFASYRTFIHSITSIIVIINTCLWILRNGPNLINGNNLDSDNS